MGCLISELKKYFEYVDGQLFWKLSNSPNCKVGCIAGTIGSKGYHTVMLHRKQYRVNRVVYMMHYGEIPENMQVDHIDGDKFNDRVENLRLVTNQENALNRHAVISTSGFKGVTLDKRSGRYIARIKLNGVHTHIGSFKTAEEAGTAYLDYREMIGIDVLN